MAASARIVLRRHASSSPRYWLQYPASAMMIRNFANSDGCSVKPPGSWNHAWLPLMFDPRGLITRNSAPTAAEVGEERVVAQASVVDGHHRDHHADPERHEHRLALHEVELVAGDAVTTRRPDHHQAERAEREHRAHEDRRRSDASARSRRSDRGTLGATWARRAPTPRSSRPSANPHQSVFLPLGFTRGDHDRRRRRGCR